MMKFRFKRSNYQEPFSPLHGALENGSYLHVNERQEIRHYRSRSTEEEYKKRMPNCGFLLRTAHVNCTIMAILYTHLIGN